MKGKEFWRSTDKERLPGIDVEKAEALAREFAARAEVYAELEKMLGGSGGLSERERQKLAKHCWRRWSDNRHAARLANTGIYDTE